MVADFMVTRRPHAVSMCEAVGWSVFYLALPLVFALALWAAFGGVQGGGVHHRLRSGAEFARDVSQMRSVRLLRWAMPVTDDYRGTRSTVREGGRRALTPFTIVVVAVFATDVVFAVDSVPAVYGATDDPYLVFATNAFALLGLRALYFVLHAALAKLTYLNHGLAIILAFIGAKLVLHWAHGIWPAVPEIPTPISLGVIVLILATVTLRDRTHPGGAGDHLCRPPGRPPAKGAHR